MNTTDNTATSTSGVTNTSSQPGKKTRKTYYYLHDHNNNVVGMIDKQGNRVATYEYGPYGEITHQSGPMAEENPIRYSSEFYNSDTGLVEYIYRHYNPKDGRWLQRDPIAEWGGNNLYGFAGNKPTNSIDLLGLYVVLCFAYKEEKIIGFNHSNPKETIETPNVFSGNGSGTNNPGSQHKEDEGPIPEGEYWIGSQYKASGYSGDNNWYKLYGDDGKGGKSYGKIPVKNPSGGTTDRGGFNLHTGRASNGCITCKSDVGQGAPNYPTSKDYDKLKKFIEKEEKKPFFNPRKPGDGFRGIMLVKKCVADCKKALEKYKN